LRAAAALCAALAVALGAAPVAAARWSVPAHPAGCSVALSLADPPLIAFPSSNPQTRSGPGALLWVAPRGCQAGGGGNAGGGGSSGSGGGAGGGGADSGGTPAASAAATATGEATGATLAADDLPGSGGPLAAGTGNLADVAAASGTAAGQVVAVGSALEAVGARGEVGTGTGIEVGTPAGAIAEGRRVGAFAAAQLLGGPAAPVAASSAYLGDTVLASPAQTRRAGWAIAVRVQRHYSTAFAAPRLVLVGGGPVSAVAATMDYRADILLVWVARGGVYAREVKQSGVIAPVRRLGSAPADTEVQALISDDGHAIVAWRSQTAAPGGAARTTIELSISGANLTFRGSPLLLEGFRDPRGYAPPAGSMRLIRLSSEAVMIAWTGVRAGHYAVRAAPVSLRRGAWAPVVISDPSNPSISSRGSDAVLADLVPGPDAEALALWRAAPRLPDGVGRVGPDSWAIVAARGHYAGHGEVFFEAPETIAPLGVNGPPAAAYDPRTGQALAAWATRARTGGSDRIAYSLRAAGPASSALPAAVELQDERSSSGSWAAAALGALALLLAAAAAAALLRGAAQRPGQIRPRHGSGHVRPRRG
jgi:hypothetical protein